MNVYRLSRTINPDLTTGTITSAVIAAPTELLARGLVAANEGPANGTNHWLTSDDVFIELVGPVAAEYLDNFVRGDDVPFVLLLSRIGG